MTATDRHEDVSRSYITIGIESSASLEDGCYGTECAGKIQGELTLLALLYGAHTFLEFFNVPH